ncbi:MAG: 2Fe-2S iron-sulfur cluster binding domain-containing protein [Granulosicoccus sp.]|nr:2Fe-2S iron-sulfur cluster binding domain-containing protein [Granulosicoccus sp.]
MSSNTLPSPARITLLPAGKEFDAAPNRSLLDAGLSAGIALPFGCANGTCGECRARVRAGEVRRYRHHDYSLTQTEKLNGVCLLCSSMAVTDCQIEVVEATSVADIPLQQLPAKLCRLESKDDAVIVAFKFSRGKALRFLPGQHVTLTYSDGFAIKLPIASCPCNAQALEFHLTADIPNQNRVDEFVARLNAGSSRERVLIDGPGGQFTLSNQTGKPKLFLVTGGEFAQVQGLIEQVFNLELQTPCALIWNSSEQTGHYLHNLCRSWQDAFDEFDYQPQGASTNALTRLPQKWVELLARSEVYLGKFDNALVQALVEQGASEESIFYPLPLSD